MPTPEFVLSLREKIGHDLLWLMGVSGYVEDEQGRVLLGRRSDTGEWAMVYGINEPGEEPADTVAREVKEETGVDVVVTDLVSVKSSRKVLTYANGDNTMYMDHLFICRPDPNGNTEPFVGDEESLSVGWFSPDALPEPLAATTVERMAYVRGEWRFPCPVCLQRHHPLKSPSIHHKKESPQLFKRCGDSFLFDSVDQLTAGRQAAHADARDACAVRADRAPAGRPAASACTGSADSA